MNHVGSKCADYSKKKHPLTTIVAHAVKLKLDALVDKFIYLSIYLAHKSVRNSLYKNKATDQRARYNVQNVVNTSDDTLLDYILFAHPFTGCDATSAIHNFDKTTIFTKLKNSNELKSTAELF